MAGVTRVRAEREAVLGRGAVATHRAAWPTGRRYELARQALMADAVVDQAADWVQNDDPAIRASKECAFLETLDAYRDEFTGS